jgi:class 3 adenylate cyclase
MYRSKSGTVELVKVLVDVLVRAVTSHEGAVDESVGASELR